MKQLQQVPWMSKPTLDQLHLRDSLISKLQGFYVLLMTEESIKMRETKLSESFVIMLNVNILMILLMPTRIIPSQCGRQLNL